MSHTKDKTIEPGCLFKAKVVDPNNEKFVSENERTAYWNRELSQERIFEAMQDIEFTVSGAKEIIILRWAPTFFSPDIPHIFTTQEGDASDYSLFIQVNAFDAHHYTEKKIFHSNVCCILKKKEQK